MEARTIRLTLISSHAKRTQCRGYCSRLKARKATRHPPQKSVREYRKRSTQLLLETVFHAFRMFLVSNQTIMRMFWHDSALVNDKGT